jgi:hypothetical protein
MNITRLQFYAIVNLIFTLNLSVAVTNGMTNSAAHGAFKPLVDAAQVRVSYISPSGVNLAQAVVPPQVGVTVKATAEAITKLTNADIDALLEDDTLDEYISDLNLGDPDAVANEVPDDALDSVTSILTTVYSIASADNQARLKPLFIIVGKRYAAQPNAALIKIGAMEYVIGSSLR